MGQSVSFSPMPQLFSFVRNRNITVHQAFVSPSAQELFHLPLSEEAVEQFYDFSNLIAGLQLQEEPDTWNYIWGSAVFTPSKAYGHLIGTRQVHPAFYWLWKSTCQKKRNIFF
jgi:hypothetical protein